MEVFSVYDSVSQVFHTPMFLRTRAEAVRGFSQQAKMKDSPISQHPTDYILYHVGTWDEETGNLESLETIARVALATDFAEPDES